MNSPKNTSTPLNNALSGPIEVGEPDVSGPLAVYPLFGPRPKLEYSAFSAVHNRVAINELQGGASVNDLAVQNDHGRSVLLYEGEELLGAQQNRVLDISVLIEAKAKTVIPVSCVEQGRWDGSRHRERFRPAPQTAPAEMRRSKNRRVRERVSAGMPARAVQGEVWSEVAEYDQAFMAQSPTGAIHDVYESRRDHLGELKKPIRRHPRQCGAVVAISGRISILDFVGRADVWEHLHPALLEGYALDALRWAERDRPADPPALQTVRGFTLLATDAPAANRTEGPGLGATVRFAANGVAGSALVAEGELVQMTAYLDEDEQPAPRSDRAVQARDRRPRVNRPSRRSHR